MIGMIGHLGQVSPRRGRACALLHLLGLILGAGALGAALGLAGLGLRAMIAGIGLGLPTPAGLGAGMALLALLCGLREWGVLAFPLPQRQRQVPRDWWCTMSTRRASFWWGMVLGAGVLTRIQYPVYYVILGLALVCPPARASLLLAACGLGQGLPLLLRTVQSASSPNAAAPEGQWSRQAHRWAGWAALFFAAYLLASLWTGPGGF